MANHQAHKLNGHQQSMIMKWIADGKANVEIMLLWLGGWWHVELTSASP